MRYILFDTSTNGCTYYVSEKKNVGVVATTDVNLAITFKKRASANNFLSQLSKPLKNNYNFSVGLLSEIRQPILQELSQGITDIIDVMNNKPKKIKYNTQSLDIPEPPKLSNGINTIQDNTQDIKNNVDSTYISSPKMLKTYTSTEILSQMDNITKVIAKTQESICKIPDTITKNQLCLNKQLSELDKIINDLTHFIEFNNLNASQGYKMYKMLHDFLNQRRQVKDMLMVIQSINSNFEDTENYDISKEFKSCNERSYSPRVLDKLFQNGKECL